MTRSLLSRIAERLEHGCGDTGILVAWSGGLDSTVLLHLLHGWSKQTGVEIAAVHVDHQLRASSGADAAFCRRLARQWGIPLVVETLDLRRRGSMQESARVQRYAAIARVSNRLGLGAVATAHHAQDAIETALINLRRGTSSAGLSSGVSACEPPIPSWPDVEIVRPLATTPRREIEAYAEHHALAFQTDPTNESVSYTRNRLRHEVLPALTDDARLVGPMVDTLQNLASERRALESMAEDAVGRALLVRPDAESVAVDCAPLRRLPEAVVALALQHIITRLPGDVALGREHVRDIVAAITVPDTVRMVPDTVRMAVRGGFLWVDRGILVAEIARGRGGRYLQEREAAPIALACGPAGEAVGWFGSRLVFGRQKERVAVKSQSGEHLWATIDCSSSAAHEALVVRGPRPGDQVRAPGVVDRSTSLGGERAENQVGHKSVGDVLAEAGVPRGFRWRWPVVVRDLETSQVEWVCGLRRAGSGVELQPAAAGESAGESSGESAGDRRSIELFWGIEPASVFARILSR